MFTLFIVTDNAAFEDAGAGEEVSRLLEEAAEQLRNGAQAGPLFDCNGNRVGAYAMEEKTDSEHEDDMARSVAEHEMSLGEDE